MGFRFYEYRMSRDGAPDVLGEILAADVDDDVLSVLSTREQRYALYYLLDHERVPLSELADVIAGWLAVADRQVTTAGERTSLRIALYHTHLPRLEAAGLIEFDPDDRVVDRAAFPTTTRELVEAARAAERWTGETTAP